LRLLFALPLQFPLLCLFFLLLPFLLHRSRPPSTLFPYTTLFRSPSISNGSNLFNQIGCALCHTPTLMTGKSSSGALDNKPVNLFSDLLVHHMGPGLGDNIIQGGAGPDEFRTAPLWGLGQRIFFLHDLRTKDVS